MIYYLHNKFVAIDQLLNACFGGDADLTISARIGFFSLRCRQHPNSYGKCYRWYWIIHEKIADWAWKPTDGPRHCLEAYIADQYEDYRCKNWWVFLILMSIVIIIVSVIVGVLLRLFGL
jgi:hypothetical protein